VIAAKGQASIVRPTRAQRILKVFGKTQTSAVEVKCGLDIRDLNDWNDTSNCHLIRFPPGPNASRNVSEPHNVRVERRAADV
jgi:hypothetical protein